MRCATAVALALCALLSGCEVLSVITGAVAGAAVGGTTANAPAGMATAIAVESGVDAVQRSFDRRAQRRQQDAIAAVAADMRAGETREWQYRHGIRHRTERGEVRVTRVIDTPLASCKELLFSVADDKKKAAPAWYATSACQQGSKWKWAAAEPAVERWGNLQ